LITNLIDDHIWLGINDIENEDVWVADDGLELNYFNWMSAQPDNNGNNEHAVHIWRNQNGRWNDHVLGYVFRVICTHKIPN
jgi:hypothetical protein